MVLKEKRQEVMGLISLLDMKGIEKNSVNSLQT